MKTIQVRQTAQGLQHKTEPNSSYWCYFPATITTAEQMKQYFAEGKHSNYPRQGITDIQFQFVDISGNPYKHYAIKRDMNFIQATVNLEKNKRIVFTESELWQPADRLQYLRDNAIYLPDDINDTNKALEYLKENEPLLIDDYKTELNQKINEAIKERCKQHAQQFNQSAIIEFLE